MPRPPASQAECGNPLFLTWIGEWMDTAKERNSKGYQTWKKAYESLRSCPITYEHPSELIRLNGIGEGICKKLEDKLRLYCTAQGLTMPLKPGQSTSTGSQDLLVIPSASQGTKRRGPTKQYIPKFRSGAWAILRALETFPPDSSVTKTDIIRVARPFCDTSFDTPTDSKFYTAWNSMKTVLEKGYVYRTGNPPKYTLTDEGMEVAKGLVKAVEAQDGGNGMGLTNDGPLQKKNKNVEPQRGWIPPESFEFMPRPEPAAIYEPPPRVRHNPIIPGADIRVLPAGSYTVKLIVDNREIHNEKDLERLELGLRDGGVDYTLRSLDVGDAIWIAKSGNEEYVLDYIVERKRMDDLVGSIKDGRFHEQKFRLMKSGMRHIIYIIEDYAGYDPTDFLEAIQTSISSSQVVNNFFVKRTRNIDETTKYLLRMSKSLSKQHQNRALQVIPPSQIDSRTFYNLKASLAQPDTYHCVRYQDFCSIVSKSASLTVGDVFLKMLMSIKGISAEKAMEIQKHFPTMIELVETLAGVDEEEGRMVVARRCSKYGRRKIGNVLSGKVYEVFRPQ